MSESSGAAVPVHEPTDAAAASESLLAAGKSAPPPLTRRRWLRRMAQGLFAAGVTTGAYAHWYEPHWVTVVRRDLPVDDLPAGLEGRTLLQISDIHAGPVVSDRYLIRAFRTAQALKPDIVVGTGDYITYRNGSVWKQVDRVYPHFPKGRLATVGCLGNHDYGPDWRDSRIADELCRRMSANGIEILRPGIRDVEGLSIVGLEDLWGSHWNRESAMSVIPQQGPAIVLLHNPDGCDIGMWRKYRGWILSGHTHGGQCRLPFCSPPVLPVMNHRYTAGAFDLGKGRQLYINRGLGHLLQVRFFVRPEITLFTLRNTANPSPA